MTPAEWPLFGLELTTSRLVLRPPTDDDFPALLEAIDAGIHDPSYMPFSSPWTERPRDERAQSALQFWWRTRATWTSDDWQLVLAVFHQGRAVGVQEIMGKQFLQLREVTTGSWLTQAVQGQGLGKEMRAAALAFAFGHLGAQVARSDAYDDNPRSLGVSRGLGYRDNGTSRHLLGDGVKTLVNLEMTAAEWVQVADRWPTTVSGFGACQGMFGLDG